jgi:signal transduction histidine kinase
MKQWRTLLLYSLPLALAVGVVFVVNGGLISDFLFVGHLEISLSNLVMVAGICSTTTLVIRALALSRNREREGRIQAKVSEQHAAAQHRFLQRLDHELKNPLTTIQLGLANLQSSIPLEEHQSFTRIEEQTRRLQGLVEGLRRLSKLETIDFERESVDLNELLEEVVNLMRATVSSHCLVLNVRQIPWKLPLIWGDRDLLEVAFRNLLDNAIKYTPSDGTIEVRASENGHDILVEIADTGVGIQADDLPHIYEELYRGLNAREIAGSGLGLAIVKRIIDLHQGQIDISSRPGKGTVITLHLPLAPMMRN